MKILGVVAEYDPFHRGHARHLRLAGEKVRPDLTYIALSGCVKQRGEPAMLSPHDRARCALAAGADAVFALPAVWTVRDAEHYALGAVSMLRDLGVTHLAFGAETDRLDLLRSAAERMENPTEGFTRTLKTALAEGEGYPRAVRAAMAAESPECAALLDRPNNILAVCYLRAVLRLGASVAPVLIPRGGDYHAKEIRTEEPSASAVRGALERGDYARAYAAVPEETRTVIQNAFLAGNVPKTEILDTLLIRRLRSMSREEIAALPDVGEGMENLLLDTARKVRTREQLLDAVSGKRYPRARISRICAAAMLGMRREETESAPLPREAVLLGLRKNPEMTAQWRALPIRVTTEWGSGTDLRAWQLRAQCAGLPDTLPWTEKVVTE